MASAKSEGLRLEAHEAKDSRGRPTVEVKATLGTISTIGDVPAIQDDHLTPLAAIDDIRGTAAYRRHAVGVLLRRAIAA